MKNTILAFIILTCLPKINAQAICSSEKWDSIFTSKKVNGTFVLHNISSGKSDVYNLARCDSTYLPASTFKILNSLIALETNAINSVDDSIIWDGVDYGWDKWNKAQTMRTAMPLSCVWFYQELARRIGAINMQKHLDAVGYGNRQMGAQIDNFWLKGDLRISAIEQVEFLKRLIKNELPFSIKNQELVKEIMITDSTEHYVVHSKTGWALAPSPQIGWFVGYVETKDNTWIFALNIDVNTKADLKLRKQITYEILKSEGVIIKSI